MQPVELRETLRLWQVSCPGGCCTWRHAPAVQLPPPSTLCMQKRAIQKPCQLLPRVLFGTREPKMACPVGQAYAVKRCRASRAGSRHKGRLWIPIHMWNWGSERLESDAPGMSGTPQGTRGLLPAQYAGNTKQRSFAQNTKHHSLDPSHATRKNWAGSCDAGATQLSRDTTFKIGAKNCAAAHWHVAPPHAQPWTNPSFMLHVVHMPLDPRNPSTPPSPPCTL